MISGKSYATFIRYYRIVPVTILGAVIGFIYSNILYFSKLSALNNYIPGALLGTATAMAIGYSVLAFDFLFMNRVIRKAQPWILLITRIIAYSIFALFWISLLYIFIYGIRDRLPLHEIGLKFRENGRIQIVSAGAVTMTIIAVFFYQISLMQSRNALVNYLLGRYSKPKRMKKIFMFLDLTSSTTHAEHLGDLKFSSLLQDCFFDLARSVHETNGDVYQYIGDEAVLVWDYLDEKKNSNCIECFMRYRDTLQKRGEFYMNKYGFVPRFKAGIHGGDVVVVRVGEIKKEIAYHGDVLNTTARLESLCNQMQTPLVISGNLLRDIHLNGELKFEQMPSVPLKGKEQSVEIFRLLLQ
ncbi:MAG TPA: adenylate/guanylate cyclase domain-containing protein [Chitinophagales bacterium]|nr:adenylate/guanylate cyclase domain-containing protein [Chitinophagales bacterium]